MINLDNYRVAIEVLNNCFLPEIKGKLNIVLNHISALNNETSFVGLSTFGKHESIFRTKLETQRCFDYTYTTPMPDLCLIEYVKNNKGNNIVISDVRLAMANRAQTLDDETSCVIARMSFLNKRKTQYDNYVFYAKRQNINGGVVVSVVKNGKLSAPFSYYVADQNQEQR